MLGSVFKASYLEVGLGMIKVFEGGIKSEKVILEDMVPKPVAPYSQGIKVGNFLFIYGMGRRNKIKQTLKGKGGRL